MAWQIPTHTCGHDGERYQAYGPGAGRERELARIESHPCPDCLKKAADEAAQKAGLPMLSGSPKQIAWATEIRERALRLHPDGSGLRRSLMGCFTFETSAEWYIDNRFKF